MSGQRKPTTKYEKMIVSRQHLQTLLKKEAGHRLLNPNSRVASERTGGVGSDSENRGRTYGTEGEEEHQRKALDLNSSNHETHHSSCRTCSTLLLSHTN
jgi:hypothetical protein